MIEKLKTQSIKLNKEENEDIRTNTNLCISAQSHPGTGRETCCPTYAHWPLPKDWGPDRSLLRHTDRAYLPLDRSH